MVPYSTAKLQKVRIIYPIASFIVYDMNSILAALSEFH